MVDLLRVARPDGKADRYPSSVDLHELLALPSVRANTRLWTDSHGQLAAFAIVDEYNNLLFEMVPGVSGPSLAAEMVSWGAQRVRSASGLDRLYPSLDASCGEEDPERLALLEHNGFIRQSGHSVHMSRSLGEPLPAVELPEGFRIRPLRGEAEVPAVVELHRAAFGSDAMTADYRLAMLRAPEYEPALDLVVEAPDGELAAYLLCHYSRQENDQTGRQEGWTDPIGVHPAYQRRGLGRALLLHGMRLLAERGLDTARLCTSGDNLAMRKTAEAVGFTVQSVTWWLSKPIYQLSMASMEAR